MNSNLSPQSAATIERLIRLAGPVGIIGGIALAAAYIAHPPEAPQR